MSLGVGASALSCEAPGNDPHQLISVSVSSSSMLVGPPGSPMR